MNQNQQLIFDVNTSRLYEPDGAFLKTVYCPYSKWRVQLASAFRSKTDSEVCEHCQDVVLNADALPIEQTIEAVRQNPNTCLHASSTGGKVIFLQKYVAGDDDECESSEDCESANITIIKTARNIEDINRAAARGLWPDVRLVKFDTDNLHRKVSVGQNMVTGEVETSSDYRSAFPGSERGVRSFEEDRMKDWKEVIPFTYFYPYYQNLPIAAYLIPKGLPDGSKVIVQDPIEDLPGTGWNQGDVYRARDVPGKIKNRKVVLKPGRIKRSFMVG